MLIISYDLSNDKLRAKFAKFLLKYGVRLQYSVFEIKNSQRLLDIIVAEVDKFYAPKFSGADSVLIFSVMESKVIKYGNAIHRDQSLVVVG